MQNIPGKVPFEDFYRKSIEILKKQNKIDPSTKKPYPGVHVVMSGFNEAFKKYYGFDPRPVTDQLAAEGKIGIWKFSKKGPTIFLPEDTIEKKQKFNPDEHFPKFDVNDFGTTARSPETRSALDDIIEEGRKNKSSVDDDAPPFYNLTPHQQDIYKRITNKSDADNERSFNPANRRKKCAKPNPKRIKKSSKPSKSRSKKICSCKKRK